MDQNEFVSSSFEAESVQSGSLESQPDTAEKPIGAAEQAKMRRISVRIIGIVFIVFSVLEFGVLSQLAPVHAAFQGLIELIEPRSDQPPIAASPATFSEHELERVDTLQPQQQASVLLQGAINHYAGAIDQIPQRVEGWRGNLERAQELETLVNTAMNSNDLRVRAAGIEVQLAVDNLAKNEQSADYLVSMFENTPSGRPYALWTLGLLANRGVARERVSRMLLDHIGDSDPEVRRWAVEGLSLTGSDEVIEPLLEKFHDDPSPQVRERAACGLAQSGMFSQEQRMRAVPTLLYYSDDPALDAQTKNWVYQALRDISGQSLPADPAAWRNWYASANR